MPTAADENRVVLLEELLVAVKASDMINHGCVQLPKGVAFVSRPCREKWIANRLKDQRQRVLEILRKLV